MRWLDRLLDRFLPHHPDAQAAELNRVMRETAQAQLRIATVADEVVDAATQHRARVDAARAKIVERAKVHEDRKRRGQTSETLSLVEEVLSRPLLGGKGYEDRQR